MQFLFLLFCLLVVLIQVRATDKPKCRRSPSDGHLIMSGIENGYVLVTVGDLWDRDSTLCFWALIEYNGDPMPIVSSGQDGEPESWAVLVRAGGYEKGALEFRIKGTPELLARGLFDKEESEPKWHHYCAVHRLAREKALYRDGALLRNVPLDTSQALPPHHHEDQAQRVFIGAQQGSQLLFSGALDELQIYGSALSEAQVKVIFDNKDRTAVTELQKELLLFLPFREQSVGGKPHNFRTADNSKSNSVALLRGKGVNLAPESAHYFDCPEARYDKSFDFLGFNLPNMEAMRKHKINPDDVLKSSQPQANKRQDKDEL